MQMQYPHQREDKDIGAVRASILHTYAGHIKYIEDHTGTDEEINAGTLMSSHACIACEVDRQEWRRRTEEDYCQHVALIT